MRHHGNKWRKIAAAWEALAAKGTAEWPHDVAKAYEQCQQAGTFRPREYDAIKKKGPTIKYPPPPQIKYPTHPQRDSMP